MADRFGGSFWIQKPNTRQFINVAVSIYIDTTDISAQRRNTVFFWAVDWGETTPEMVGPSFFFCFFFFFRKSSHPFVVAEPLWSENRVFAQGKILRVCSEFFQGVHGIWIPSEQGVVLALRKSHHRDPFTLTTVAFDQRCHKGLPLRVPMVLPEECFGVVFPSV